MHFLDGRSIADVARALSADQKRLYRVKDGALRKLARLLSEGGITEDQIRSLLGGELPPPEPPPDSAGNSDESWLSNDV